MRVQILHGVLYATIAQLVEQLISNQQAESSNLSSGSHHHSSGGKQTLWITQDSALQTTRQGVRREVNGDIWGCVVSTGI